MDKFKVGDKVKCISHNKGYGGARWKLDYEFIIDAITKSNENPNSFLLWEGNYGVYDFAVVKEMDLISNLEIW